MELLHSTHVLHPMILVLLASSLPTLTHTCTVPLSLASNQTSGFVVNDNSDGINTVQIKISTVNKSHGLDEPNTLVPVVTTTEGYSSEIHTRCISVQTDSTTVAESCEENIGGNGNELSWEIRFAGHAQGFVHAFVRSKLTGMVLSIASAELSDGVVAGDGGDSSMDILVMSKDRPLEVEALLDSIYRLCVGFNRIFVIFLPTDKVIEAKYRMAAERYPQAEFMLQGDFREDVLRVVEQSSAAFMFPIVGEMVFIRPFNFTEAVGHLRKLGPFATVHPRLGTQLDLFRSLQRRFGEAFYTPLDPQGSFGVFKATLAQQNVCRGDSATQAPVGSDETWFLNDFWWIQHLGGVIHSRRLLLDTWKRLRFSHPGDLEVAWSTLTRQLNGASHVMPRLTAIVANNNAAPTRIDHIERAERLEVETWKRSQDRTVALLYDKYCFPDTQALIERAHSDAFPKEVRTEVDLISHCVER